MSGDSAERIVFPSGGVELEGLIERGSGDFGAVVAHPHPLYGGNMNNPVVEIIHQAYRNKGYTTLRFNFRGTGSSQGRYDNGIGEQDDLMAAVELLRNRGLETIELAGYSFGAWVTALTAQAQAWSLPMVWVSPPVGFIDFNPVGGLPGLKFIVTGSADDIAPPDVIRRMLQTWNPAVRFETIDGSDHFYSRHTRQLEDVLVRHI
jgi:alpha/beta superfamily hydrolase